MLLCRSGHAVDPSDPLSCETLLRLLDEHEHKEPALLGFLAATEAWVEPGTSNCLRSNNRPDWLINWAVEQTRPQPEPEAHAAPEPAASCDEVESMLAMGLPKEAVVEAVAGTELAPCVGLEAPVAARKEGESQERAGTRPVAGYQLPKPTVPAQYFPSEACFNVLVDTPDPSVALMLSMTLGHGTGLVYGERPGAGAAFFASQLALEGLLLAGLLGEGPLADAENPPRVLALVGGGWVLLRKADAAASTVAAYQLRRATLRERGCLDE